MKRSNDIIIETILAGIGVIATSAVTYVSAKITKSIKEGVENYAKSNSKNNKY